MEGIAQPESATDSPPWEGLGVGSRNWPRPRRVVLSGECLSYPQRTAKMAKTPSFLPYNPKLKAIARRLRNNMTPAEITLWQHLKGKQMDGYDFDRQKPIDEYIVDFYCKRLKLAIEVDGSSHDCEASQIQDGYRQSRLESLGVSFLRFQNSEVQHETEAVLSTIRAWISSHSVR